MKTAVVTYGIDWFDSSADEWRPTNDDIPTKQKALEIIRQWREQGYKCKLMKIVNTREDIPARDN